MACDSDTPASSFWKKWEKNKKIKGMKEFSFLRTFTIPTARR
jgi:hypothetical protein